MKRIVDAMDTADSRLVACTGVVLLAAYVVYKHARTSVEIYDSGALGFFNTLQNNIFSTLNAPATLLGEAVNTAGSTLNNAVHTAGSTVSNVAGSAASAVGGVANAAQQTVTGATSSIVSTLKWPLVIVGVGAAIGVVIFVASKSGGGGTGMPPYGMPMPYGMSMPMPYGRY